MRHRGRLDWILDRCHLPGIGQFRKSNIDVPTAILQSFYLGRQLQVSQGRLARHGRTFIFEIYDNQEFMGLAGIERRSIPGKR